MLPLAVNDGLEGRKGGHFSAPRHLPRVSRNNPGKRRVSSMLVQDDPHRMGSKGSQGSICYVWSRAVGQQRTMAVA